MAQQQEAEQQHNTQDPQQKQLQVNAQESSPATIYPNPPHFAWPTSKRGPRATQPPPGMRPMPGRTEQALEVGYNQETGTPSSESPLRTLPDANTTGQTAFDQPRVKGPGLKKRKK